MAAVPKTRGQPRRHHRVRRRGRLAEASPSRTATRSWACKGIENGVTRFHQVRVPGREPARQGGRGPQDRPDHAQHRPAVDPGDVRRRRQVVRSRSPASGRPSASSGASRSASTRRSRPRSSFIAATTFALEAVLDLSAQLADAGSKDIRIEAALAKLWASEMACKIADELVQIRGGRGYETADSLAARGERAVPAEQIAARPADQPDLRGLVGDHAAADRPRGGRRAPEGRRRPRRARRRPAGQGEGGGQGQRLLRQVAAASWSSARAPCPTSYDEFGALAKHLRFVERSSRKLARQTFYGMGRWQAKLEYRQAFLGRIVDIGAELFAMAAACSRAEMLARRRPRAGRRGVRAGRRLLRAGAAAGRGAVRRAVEQHRRRRPGDRARSCSTASTPGSRTGVHRPVRGHRPVDRDVASRASRASRTSHARYR